MSLKYEPSSEPFLVLLDTALARAPASCRLATMKRELCYHHHRLAPRTDWYVIAEPPAPAPHLAHAEGCAQQPYALCQLLRPVSAALASILRMDSISTSYQLCLRLLGDQIREPRFFSPLILTDLHRRPGGSTRE